MKLFFFMLELRKVFNNASISSLKRGVNKFSRKWVKRYYIILSKNIYREKVNNYRFAKAVKKI